MNSVDDRNIAAVVVTFNRLELLKEVVKGLREQTVSADKIIVVNNGSSDGTKEWLSEQNDLFVIEQANTGSSGGQYAGIKTAYEMGFDWIWTMDDDVVHEKNCLENLLENISENRIHAPLRYDVSGLPYYNDVKKFNLANPFRSLWQGVFKPEDITMQYIPAEGITFEGPLFHRSLIEQTGFPDKNFFIFADDTEFFIRAKKSKYNIFIVRDAKSNRKLPGVELTEKFSWKHYYIIRNIIAIDVMYGNLAVRILRPFGYFVKWILRCHGLKDIKVTIRAFRDGYFYKKLIIDN